MKSFLANYGVKLPPNLNSHFASSIVLPDENPDNPEFEFMEVKIKLLHDAKFKAGEKALVAIAKGLTLKKLCELVQEVETTLQPINPYLDMMVFFTLHKSTMFRVYLSHILDKERQSLSQPHRSSAYFVFSSTRDDTSMEEMKLLGDALESTEELLYRVVTGIATHLEVTACGKLSLQPLAIEREFEILALFLPQLQKKHPDLRVLKSAGLEGVKNMLELFQFEHHITDMHNVFEKYDMQGCLNDKNFLMLLDIRKELSDESRKAQLTALQATEKLQTVKSALCLHIKEDRMCLKIFPAICDSVEFYRFLEEKREKGKDTFENEYQLITTQLQHEDYDEHVLNHLGSAYGYVQPFLQKEQSLQDLMQQVLRFDADSAVMELETVNSNILLVQLWFLRSEVRKRWCSSCSCDYCCCFSSLQGETLDNIAHELSCIIKTGHYKFNFSLTRTSGRDQIELIYLPSSESSSNTSDGEATDSLDRPKYEKWNREQIDEFVRKLGFLDSNATERDCFLEQNGVGSFLYHGLMVFVTEMHQLFFFPFRLLTSFWTCFLSCVSWDIQIIVQPGEK